MTRNQGYRMLLSIFVAAVLSAGFLACKKKKDNPATTTTTTAKKRVFVKYPFEADGDLGGLTGADAICQAAATGATTPLTGTWKAWLSDSTTNAIDRMADVGPWFLVNNTTQVFASKAALTGNPAVAINMDQSGNTQSTAQPVWTNTLANGTKNTLNCSNWTSAAGNGNTGNHGSASATWTEDGGQPCASAAHLYCFEQ